MKQIARKNVLRLLVSAALLSCAGASHGQTAARTVETPAASTMSAERLGRLRIQMRRYVDEGRLAGAVILIQQDGKPVFSEAIVWRNRETRASMREDSIFRIASQTKALTSVAIMMLMEESKLLLDDPVGKHLPGVVKATAPDATRPSFCPVCLPCGRQTRLFPEQSRAGSQH